ncbi:hypothetical protein PPGU19_100410 (plasmid) [Paraburkholderia sp. PGU19]|nr:hypothetical protein PPGU19_100410 [Paraburkholderia sp. PGU19]
MVSMERARERRAFKPLNEAAMKHDSNTSGNSGSGCRIHDSSGFDCASKSVRAATSAASSANWAWTQSSDSYDWMDWHSPFAAVTRSD